MSKSEDIYFIGTFYDIHYTIMYIFHEYYFYSYEKKLCALLHYSI